MSDCLSMRGVWKGYEAGIRGCSASVCVLRDVELDVQRGEMVGIVAPPASGKTTLLLCAGGLLRPDRGTVAWFGAPPRRDATARPDGIAYASDRPFPYGFLSVREALEYAAIVRDLPLVDAASRVAHALERTALDAIAHRRVDALDGGGLARLAIAGALLARPRLLLVDDMPPGCDVATAGELFALLHLAARDGAGVVVAGRFVARLMAPDASLARVPTRTLTLSGGRLEPVSPDSLVVPSRAAIPVHARVAETTHAPARASASENRAR